MKAARLSALKAHILKLESKPIEKIMVGTSCTEKQAKEIKEKHRKNAKAMRTDISTKEL